MLTLLIYAVSISVAASWLYGIALLALTMENRRFWRSHQRRPLSTKEQFPRVGLMIPCHGMEHKLRENLTSFIHQDHPNFEICFVVESKVDSAYKLISNVMRESRHLKSRLVVAGRADDTGQKVHNLLAACSSLSREVEILVFADSDICPDTNWLRWLVHGIGGEKVGARTGYRWMIPANKSLATLIGCTINNILASTMGRGSHLLVWGGSWAIHRRVFDAVGMRQAWKGVLSDDLVASRVLRCSGLKINFEPNCVCKSSVSFNVSELLEFLRRQLILAKKYNPAYWLAAYSALLLSQLGYWGGLILGLVLIANGNVNGWWLFASSSVFYGLGIFRAITRQNMGRLVTAEWKAYRSARKFDIAAGPITGLAMLLLMCLSTFGSRVTWRRNRYHISQSGRVQFFGRKIQVDPWPLAVTSTSAKEVEQEAPLKIVNYDAKRVA